MSARAPVLDGEFRLSYVGKDAAGKIDGHYTDFALARTLARKLARDRREHGWVVFVEQYGRHVWASDGRQCPAAPDVF